MSQQHRRSPEGQRRCAAACAWATGVLCLLWGTSPVHAEANLWALGPAGPQAGRISHLYWIFFGITAGVYILVMLVLIVGLIVRRGRENAAEPIVHPEEFRERRLQHVVAGALVVTTLILFGLIISDFLTGRAIGSMARDAKLTIRVTGHQWWWGVQYADAVPSNIVSTANEIHIPVGKPVRLELDSTDVIHSFWVPSLHGKKDLIPGHPTSITLQADRPGTYWGQCAEFCGHQHAKMRLAVVAEPEEQFNRWLEGQRKAPPAPTTESQKRGQQVFLTSTCIMCHTIQGTPARASVGPNLSHLKSRWSIAAGSLPNTRGNLGGWIADPQRIKPGVRMPQNPLPPEQLRDLLDYLETLK